MRGLVLFVAGVLVGLAVQTAVAQREGAVSLNHVGIAVPDIGEAVTYYTGTLGFREAFRNSAGTSIYLQISRDTFLELQQAGDQTTPGVTHFGLDVENIRNAVEIFRQRGATATDPRGPSAFSGAILANVTDPNGIRIELAELGPDSLQRKAMAAWK
jgi:catechol 2,3-dioxygenase-like lactoylglutathione lyase family enzyme